MNETFATVAAWFAGSLQIPPDEAIKYTHGFFFALGLMKRVPEYGLALQNRSEKEDIDKNNLSFPARSIERLMVFFPMEVINDQETT